jgi:hypothetical protein
MASIFSRMTALLGGGAKRESEPTKLHVQEIDGYKVIASPMREGGQFRISGRIEKQTDGQALVRHFIRADVFTSEDEAVEATFRKANQIIAQSGKTLFADGAAEGRA